MATIPIRFVSAYTSNVYLADIIFGGEGGRYRVEADEEREVGDISQVGVAIASV